MKLVKLADLHHGDVFLTKSSKLYIFDWRDDDKTVIARRYADKYHLDCLSASSLVYLMEEL